MADIENLNIKITSNVNDAVSALSKLSGAISDLKSNTDNIKPSFATLGQALTSFDKKVAKLQNLTSISNTMVDLAASVELLTGSLSNTNATTFETLANGLKVLNQYAKRLDLSRIEDLELAMSVLGDAIVKFNNDLEGNIGNVEAMSAAYKDLADSLKEIRKGGKLPSTETSTENTGSTDLGTVEQTIDGSEAGEAIDSGISEGGMSALDKLKNYATGIFAMWKLDIKNNLSEGVAGAQDGITNVMVAVDKVVLKPFTAIGKVAAKGFALAGKAFTGIFTSAGAKIKGVADKISGIGSRIMSIASRMAIRKAINAVISGIQAGIDNVYQWAAINNSTLKSSFDSIASSTNYLKNSLGAMAAPLFSALAPAIEYIANKFVDLINIVNQFVAALTGSGTWTKAVRTQENYAEVADNSAKGTKKASDAAKEYKRTIMGFDQINALNAPNSDSGSGSSGSGGSSGTDYGSMFTTENVNGGITNFADSLKKAIATEDWGSLTSLLSEKINGLINSIDWGGLGTKFGKGFNTVINVLYSTLSAVDWKKLGGKIATFLSNAINNVDWQTMGRLLVKKFTALIDMATGFIGEFDWAGFGKAVGDIITGVFNEAADFLSSGGLSQLVYNVTKGFIDMIMGVDWFALAKAIVNFLWEGIKELVSSVFNIPKAIWDSVKGKLNPKGKTYEMDTEALLVDYEDSEIAGSQIATEAKFTTKKDALGLVSKEVMANLTNPQDKMGAVSKGVTANLQSPQDKMGSVFKSVIANLQNPVDKMGTIFKGVNVTLANKSSLENSLSNLKGSVSLSVKSMSVDKDYELFTTSNGTIRARPKANAMGGVWTGSQWKPVNAYADGGVVGGGELFVAREAGPEMVGTIGNRTAVVNNDQIVSSIAAGVASACQSVLGGLNNAPTTEFTFKIDSEEIYKAVRRGQQKYNRRYTLVEEF